MNRRSFLLAGGGSLAFPGQSLAQPSLGALVWVESRGIRACTLPDGTPVTLASGTGLHSPRFSPSGAWIAYRHGEDRVFVVPSDGGDVASLDGQSSKWMPQDRLAVTRGADTAVYTPANRWMVPEAIWKDTSLGPAHPDGRQYAATRVHRRPADRNGLNQDRAELYVAAENQRVRVLIPENEGNIRPYCWTGDGRQLIYWRADEWSASLWSDGIDLYAIAAAGGPERKLQVSTLVHEDMLALAPVGDQIVAVAGQGRETWARQQLVGIDLNTGAKRDLTPPEIAVQGPSWSPDGRRVAYSAAPDAELAEAKAEAGTILRTLHPDGSITTTVRRPETRIGIGGGEVAHRYLHLRKIWVLDPLSSGRPRQLTADPRCRDEEPTWSADGSHILFARMDYAGHPSLWLLESSGSDARQICSLQIYADAGFEPGWFGYYGYIDWHSAFDWRR